MNIKIDRNIYPDACISKAVYSMGNDYVINRTLHGSVESIQIEPVNGGAAADAERAFVSALNDYKLRQIIETETHDIRIILYAKAFADFDDTSDEEI